MKRFNVRDFDFQSCDINNEIITFFCLKFELQ